MGEGRRRAGFSGHSSGKTGPPPCLSEGKNTPLIHSPIVPFYMEWVLLLVDVFAEYRRNEESREGSCDSGKIGKCFCTALRNIKERKINFP